MTWALVIANAHRSPIGGDVADALVARGLRVSRLAPTAPATDVDPRADVVLLDFSDGLEPAGKRQREAIEEASGTARLLVIVFRQDQLVAGVESLGLGAPVATLVETERSTQYDPFVEVAAGRAAGVREPLHARMTAEARRMLARYERRGLVMWAAMILSAWTPLLAADGHPEGAFTRVVAWAVTGIGLVGIVQVLATGRSDSLIEFSLQGDDLFVHAAPTGRRALFRRRSAGAMHIRRDGVDSIREHAQGLSLRGTALSSFVPRGLERYGELRAALAQWTSIERHRIPLPPAIVLVVVVTNLSAARPIEALPWARALVLGVSVAIAVLLVAASIVNEGIPHWRRWGQRMAAVYLLLLGGWAAHDAFQARRPEAAYRTTLRCDDGAQSPRQVSAQPLPGEITLPGKSDSTHPARPGARPRPGAPHRGFRSSPVSRHAAGGGCARRGSGSSAPEHSAIRDVPDRERGLRWNTSSRCSSSSTRTRLAA